MKEKFDTSWFDLKNYEALKSMSIEDWQKLLGERYEFYRHVKSCREGFYEFMHEQGAYFQCDFLDSLVPPEELLIKISSLLKQGVITNFGLGSSPLPDTLNNPMASGSSVNNLTVHDVIKMSNDSRLHYKIDNPNEKEARQEEQKKLKKILSKSFEESYDGNHEIEIIFPSYEELRQEKQKHWQEMLSKPFEEGHDRNAKIKIDLSATDAKLRKDFDQWLKDIRESTGYYDNIPKKISKIKLSNKELYTLDDFNHWIKFCVIPYIDLMLVAEIEYKKITQEELAPILFPNDPDPDLDTLTRVTQVTKPLAEQLIKNRIDKTLLAQLAYQISPT